MLKENVTAEEKRFKVFKIWFLAWIMFLVLCSCIIQYGYRNLPDSRSRKKNINSADDDLIKKALKIESGHVEIRKKRAIDTNAYREMGWRFTPAEAKLVFQKYYNCITERNLAKSDNNQVKAILALEGQSVKLECRVCFRPDQDPSTYDIEWQQLRTKDGVLRYVEENHRIKITPDKMLAITDVDVVDSGQYFCVQTNIKDYIEIYQLDVVFRERRISIPEFKMNELLPTVKMDEHNLQLFTLWSGWSMCNQCNRIGKRRKVGICMVNKIYNNRPIKPLDIPIISLYPDGIPCRSTLLPRELARLRKIRFRPSETIIGDCFMDCPTTPSFLTVTDSSGRVIESIQTGYHSINHKPSLPPMVDRRVIFTNTGEKLVLKCPDDSQTNCLIRWQNGSIPLNPLTLRRQTRGRVEIDTINRLKIRGLRLTDTGIYSCWSGKRLISTIKVVITTGVANDVHVIIQKAGILMTVVCLIVSVFCVIRIKLRKKPKY